MNSLPITALESNKSLKFNFSGGDLTSDAGLILFHEFMAKLGFDQLIQSLFRTNDTASYRIHTDTQNLMQMIYQIFCAYFEDNCADELSNDPVMKAMLGKDSLASQPTLSRFFNRMDQDTLDQFDLILQEMRRKVYAIQSPEQILFDIDTTLLTTFGHQEGEAFNYHYKAHGYHPFVCYDGLTGDLLKLMLREGSKYCSNGIAAFMEPLIEEFTTNYPRTKLYLRGDSGFATPELYDLCEDKNVKYAVRLKDNPVLRRMIADKDDALYHAVAHKDDQISYAVTYGEFMYQANGWRAPRRVVFKIEKPKDQFIHTYTFIVTNMTMQPYQVIQYYCGRGRMENFIKEGKDGFDFAAVSSNSMVVNANRLQIHGMTYNIFNWFRRLVLAASLRKQRINTIRIKLVKIAAKAVHSARYVIFKLCSSCPYKDEFYETLNNINRLGATLLL